MNYFEEEQRYTIYPIAHQDIWDCYVKQRGMFWVPAEVDTSGDKVEYDKMTNTEKTFINHILGFFASADSIVMLNVMNNFAKDVCLLEAQCCYAFQAMMETIHGEMYSILLDTYIDNAQKEALMNAMSTIPSIQRKAAFAQKYSDPSVPFPNRLFAYVLIEGIFFSSSFCSIYYLKYIGKNLNGLFVSNEFICRDEGYHVDFGIMMFNKLNQYKLSQTEAFKMIEEAVDIEKDFIDNAISSDLIGMNTYLLGMYSNYIADGILAKCNYDKLYNVICPFTFMVTLGMNTRENFFEKRTTNYQKNSAIRKPLAMEDDF